MSQSRVFVTHQPKPNRQNWVPNFTPAEKFGALHFVFAGDMRPSSDPMGAIWTAQEALEDFNPNSDYLLWPNSGDPAAIVAICFILARKDIKKVNMLVWERKLVNRKRTTTDGYYVAITFDLPAFDW